MVAASPGKTPISLLQEYGTRLGRTPGYDLLKARAQGPPAQTSPSASPSGTSAAPGPPLEMKSPVSPPQAECNPVGALQELVVQKGWRLPEYTVTQESGPAHRKEFTMTCRVERFVEIGSGTSKKLAKRNAAAKMLVRIHNVPMEPRDGSEAEGEEDQFNMELSEEQSFAISYLDIDALSLSGLHQCLVELSTQPTTVCHGAAPSRDGARAQAARNALQYLRIMAGGK
ncbi:hypothetical protein DUI87_33208 [Hirundo rustica rustica]|uniref:DRBM domain-containing protein n=1 Tax=Hirundo rustica rustica TaxID=333673 RepID=A0A3M0IPF7_HIRRU|nr:hypothetical protein DUI87_33208 [Hirundo rustica rustica]